MAGMTRTWWTLLIGFAAFIIAFIAIMVFAIIRFTYYSGPIPFAPYALPIPLVIGLFAGMLAYRVKNPN
jgi:hypothetical protein